MSAFDLTEPLGCEESASWSIHMTLTTKKDSNTSKRMWALTGTPTFHKVGLRMTDTI